MGKFFERPSGNLQMYCARSAVQPVFVEEKIIFEFGCLGYSRLLDCWGGMGK